MFKGWNSGGDVGCSHLMGVSSYTSTEESAGAPARNGWPSHKALAASILSASTML
jgi:hypothetical protein